MNITIDEAVIAEVIDESIRTTVCRAIQDYPVQLALSQALASEITNGTIVQAIKEAIDQVETNRLAETLAREIQRATVKATVAIVQEGMIDAIAKMRGLSLYTEEDKRERERLRQQIFGRRED